MSTTATRTSPTKRLDWAPILAKAAEIVKSYTSTSVMLRQLFYRLVALELLPNTLSTYKRLSSLTAAARRDGGFPPLSDGGRTIHRFTTFTDPAEARDWLGRIYRRDRTKGQQFNLYLGVEKEGLVAQLVEWFGNFGVPVVALRGYSSQTYVDDIREDAEADGRPAILLYAGDFDPSGEDILRDFRKRCPVFTHVERVALTAEQVRAYRLPPQMGKTTDPRAAGFIAEHGELVQVELDALAPTDLRRLFEEHLYRYWDTSTFEDALARERVERATLAG